MIKFLCCVLALALGAAAFLESISYGTSKDGGWTYGADDCRYLRGMSFWHGRPATGWRTWDDTALRTFARAKEILRACNLDAHTVNMAR